MNRLVSVAALLGAVLLVSCEKNAVQALPEEPLPGAQIKFFNFGLNAPAVNFYAGETKMTAVFTTDTIESVTGVAYGSVGNGGLYLGLAPGTYTLTGRIAAATDKNLAIDTISATLADGGSYSFYLSGSYDATAKNVDAFIVEDPLAASWDYAAASVRFVNALYNAKPMTLYLKNTDTTVTKDSIPVGGEVAYKAAGPFTAVPNGVYNLITRYTGSNTSIISRTNVSFVLGHMYTIAARGDTTVKSSTATNRPFLDNTANR